MYNRCSSKVLPCTRQFLHAYSGKELPYHMQNLLLPQHCHEGILVHGVDKDMAHQLWLSFVH